MIEMGIENTIILYLVTSSFPQKTIEELKTGQYRDVTKILFNGLIPIKKLIY